MTGALVEKPDRRRTEWRISLGSLVATTLSMLLVYRFAWASGAGNLHRWAEAGLFAASLMSVMVAHEAGHLLVARAYRIPMSWPIFIPFPYFLGTLGAVMRLDEPPRTREGLVRLGLAGPLAGMAVVVLILLVSVLFVGDRTPGDLSVPLLFFLVEGPLQWAWSPAPSTSDPLALAAWTGCLLTSMNLMPIGQLDGGHVVTAIDPRWTRWLTWAATIGLLALAFWWPAWALWVAVLHVVGVARPVSLRAAALPRSERVLATLFYAIAMILTFTPWPSS